MKLKKCYISCLIKLYNNYNNNLKRNLIFSKMISKSYKDKKQKLDMWKIL